MVWSLLGEKDKSSLKKEMSVFEKKWEEKVNSKEIEKKVRSSKIIMVVLIVFALFLFLLWLNLRNDLFFGLGIIMVIISFYVPSIIKKQYRNLLIDFLNIEIAKEKGWLYSSEKKSEEQKSLGKKVPLIFKKGNTHNRYVENQFYGDLEINNKKIHFHFGNFFYEISSGSGEDRRTTPYYKHFLSFKNPKLISFPFLITPENVFSKIGDIFKKENINLESNEFNRKFFFKYNGDKTKAKQEIAKIMTPSTQLKFLDLQKNKKVFDVLFEKEFTVFLFNGFLFDKVKSDLTKNKKIDKEDIKNIEKEISSVKNIIREIVGIFR